MTAAYCLPSVLQKPTAVFRGLLREKDQERSGRGWLCYCGRPEYAYDRDGGRVPPREGFVFLAFMTDDFVVYNWRWEKANPEDPNLPLEMDPVRFEERVL